MFKILSIIKMSIGIYLYLLLLLSKMPKNIKQELLHLTYQNYDIKLKKLF